MRYSNALVVTTLRRGVAFSALLSLLLAAAVVPASPASAGAVGAQPQNSASVSLQQEDGILAATPSALVSTDAMASGVAQARSGADFDPGYIISDELFYRSGDMSQAEIQSFLSAMVG
jgi:hypothetical protein